MKAVVIDRYNKNDISVSVREVAAPACGENDVLVRVKAAGVNPLDNMITRGEVKLVVPYAFPLVMGNELAGVVEKVGANVTAFASGDRVYGRLPLGKIGAFAELCAVDAGALAKIPDYLSFEEAAAVPLTALTAMQAFELLNAKAGDTVFLSGGTGSLGAMAIPILKAKGLRVITSGSAKNRDRVMALGVERFIDYKTEDYAAVLHDVDCVLDTVGDKELEKEFSILKPGGTLVSLKGMPNKAFAKRQGFGAFKQMLFGFAGKKYDDMAKRRGQTYHFMFVHSDGRQLQEISDLFAQLQIRPSVDAVFPLEEADAALKKIASGGSRGKTILTMKG